MVLECDDAADCFRTSSLHFFEGRFALLNPSPESAGTKSWQCWSGMIAADCFRTSSLQHFESDSALLSPVFTAALKTCRDAKLAVLEWDDAADRFSTSSLRYFEGRFPLLSPSPKSAGTKSWRRWNGTMAADCFRTSSLQHFEGDSALLSPALTAALKTCRDAKLAVLEWDDAADRFRTSSLHYFEGDKTLRGGRRTFARGPKAVCDPQACLKTVQNRERNSEQGVCVCCQQRKAAARAALCWDTRRACEP